MSHSPLLSTLQPFINHSLPPESQCICYLRHGRNKRLTIIFCLPWTSSCSSSNTWFSIYLHDTFRLGLGTHLSALSVEVEFNQMLNLMFFGPICLVLNRFTLIQSDRVEKRNRLAIKGQPMHESRLDSDYLLKDIYVFQFFNTISLLPVRVGGCHVTHITVIMRVK